MAYVRHATWIAALDRAEKAERELAEARAERDDLRTLIETGHSRGAEISPLIRRIFSAGSRAAADRAALQAKLAAAEADLLKHKDDRSYWAAKAHEEVLMKRAAEQRERRLREALEGLVLSIAPSRTNAFQLGYGPEWVEARAALTPPGAGE